MKAGNGVMRRLKGFMLKRMHSMITCREFETFIMDYLDGALPADQLRKFEWHLKICRECRDYLAAYQRTIEVGQLALGQADESVPEDVSIGDGLRELEAQGWIQQANGSETVRPPSSAIGTLLIDYVLDHGEDVELRFAERRGAAA